MQPDRVGHHRQGVQDHALQPRSATIRNGCHRRSGQRVDEA